MNLPKGIKEEIIQKSMKTRAFILVCDMPIVTVKHHENIQNDIYIIVVVVVLRPRSPSKVMSGRSVNLTTLFLGRLRPPKPLTSTSCTYFPQ